jgi:hypothetical protein
MFPSDLSHESLLPETLFNMTFLPQHSTDPSDLTQNNWSNFNFNTFPRSAQDMRQIGSWPSYDDSDQARSTMHASTDQSFRWHADGERSTDTVKVLKTTDLPDLQHNVVQDSIAQVTNFESR